MCQECWYEIYEAVNKICKSSTHRASILMENTCWYYCVSYLLLCNKLQWNLLARNSTYLLSYSFCGSGIRVHLCWVVLVGVSWDNNHVQALLGKIHLWALLGGLKGASDILPFDSLTCPSLAGCVMTRVRNSREGERECQNISHSHFITSS